MDAAYDSLHVLAEPSPRLSEAITRKHDSVQLGVVGSGYQPSGGTRPIAGMKSRRYIALAKSVDPESGEYVCQLCQVVSRTHVNMNKHRT